MADTGKMERLFERCTSTPLLRKFGEGSRPTMVFPGLGDPDGIAEQVGLYIDLLEERVEECHGLTDAAEKRLAYVMGEVRRAHTSLDGAIKGAEVKDGEGR